MAIVKPPVVSPTDWRAALSELAKQEEAAAEQLDRLAAARKRMPMVRVERDYRFDWPQEAFA